MSEQEPQREQGQDEAREQGQQPGESGQPGRPGLRRAPAKARLIFRDPLDQQSRDDTDTGWGERPGAGAGESGGRGLDWYLSQRPPHHGD
ncbi:hypothetical protein [Kitasatospora sp. NPDC097643]|uniref:hypothetical protein n=1 Tax=Kitasatospora sp. NPDC097643 TaxID=3157230 RepID=UPI00331E8FDA